MTPESEREPRLKQPRARVGRGCRVSTAQRMCLTVYRRSARELGAPAEYGAGPGPLRGLQRPEPPPQLRQLVQW